MPLDVRLPHGGAFALLWIDLETTGEHESRDEIIEIGATVTDFNFERLDPRADRDFSEVIEPSNEALGRLMKNHTVRQMHLDNDLLTDCLSGSDEIAKSIGQAERDLIRWLSMAINSRKSRGDVTKFRFQLAGSGVGHFDRRFIRKHMPTLDSLLVFAPLDVGQVRRFLKVSGIDPSFADNTKAKNHRALDDVLLHLEEARAYRDMFNQLFNAKFIIQEDGTARMRGSLDLTGSVGTHTLEAQMLLGETAEHGPYGD